RRRWARPTSARRSSAPPMWAGPSARAPRRRTQPSRPRKRAGLLRPLTTPSFDAPVEPCGRTYPGLLRYCQYRAPTCGRGGTSQLRGIARSEQVVPATEPELRKDVADVRLHRRQLHEQLAGDLSVREPLQHEPDDLALPLRQARPL